MRTTTVDDPSAVHACAVPGSDEQLWEMTARFLGDGLAAGEQVIYYADGTADAVLERLVDDRVPVDRPLADGQLTVIDAEGTRAALRRPVREAASALAAAIDDAVDAGYTGLRVTGQLNYGLLRPGGVSLADHDRIIDTVLAGRPGRVLCFYDRRRFPDDTIERMSRAAPGRDRGAGALRRRPAARDPRRPVPPPAGRRGGPQQPARHRADGRRVAGRRAPVRRRPGGARTRPVVAALPRRRGRRGAGARGRGVPRGAPALAHRGAPGGAARSRPLRRPVRRAARRHRTPRGLARLPLPRHAGRPWRAGAAARPGPHGPPGSVPSGGVSTTGAAPPRTATTSRGAGSRATRSRTVGRAVVTGPSRRSGTG